MELSDRIKTASGPLWDRSIVWNSRRGNHLGQRSCASAPTGRTYGRKQSDHITAKNLARRVPSAHGNRSTACRRWPPQSFAAPLFGADLDAVEPAWTVRSRPIRHRWGRLCSAIQPGNIVAERFQFRPLRIRLLLQTDRITTRWNRSTIFFGPALRLHIHIVIAISLYWGE